MFSKTHNLNFQIKYFGAFGSMGKQTILTQFKTKTNYKTLLYENTLNHKHFQMYTVTKKSRRI